MKKWLSLLLALVLVFSVAGTALAEDTINLRFAYWGSGAEKAGIEKAVASFMEAYPNIKVELMHIPDDFETKLNAMIAANEAPDVCYSGAWKIQLGKDGLIYNYHEIAALDPTIDPEDVVEYCWWDWSPTESAGPFQASVTPSLNYNVDMFLEAGLELPPTKAEDAWTWDEFVEICQKLTIDRNGNNALSPDFDPENIKQYGIKISTGWSGYYPFVLSNGGSYLSEDGTEFGLNKPEATEALQKIADLRNVYHVHPTATQSASLPSDAVSLQTRRVAMAITGSYVQADLIETEDLNWGVGVLPKMKEYANFFNGGSLIIFKSTANVEAALKLHNWIINPANCIELHQGLWIPHLKSWLTEEDKIQQWASEELPGRPAGFYDAVIQSTLEHQYPAPENNVNNFAEINAIVKAVMDLVYSGEMTAQEAMDSIADEVAPLVDGWSYK